MNAVNLAELHRRQLGETADHLAAAIASAAASPDAVILESLATRLYGTQRLALQLRAEILAAQKAGDDLPF